MSKRKTWPYERTDKREKALKSEVLKVRHYVNKLYESYMTGSILTDIDYDEAFTAMEKIYTLAEIDKLGAENRERNKKYVH